MVALKEHFEIPAKMKTWSLALTGIGLVAIIIGFFTHAMGGDATQHSKDIFWGTMLYNALYFMLICNAAMFFICATTLAMGGWQMTFRRIPEAISAATPVFGIIAFVIMLIIIFGMGDSTSIYPWLNKEALEKAQNEEVLGKLGFLNRGFYIIWTILTIGLWVVLGARMRKLSREADDVALQNQDNGKSFIWRNTVTASLFIVWFALTVGSTAPWLWMMSIDANWYSTMYSWYTFASSFVAGMSLIALWVIYLKNKGYLEYTNQEHLHDLGKFMFAFSIFWTYLWFAQYMLIWYGNIPEETVYFKTRVQGAFKGVFFLNIIINFVCPILILMSRPSKRNYTLMTFMGILIIFGHWLDFYQMVMGSIRKESATFGWLDFGTAAFFVGIMIYSVSRSLASKPLVAKYHPFFKESIIHHT
ncbi:MAG TPA: hypothetical protein VHB48_01900 [Chitinophagaceae bacterium]|nr:hypothetical protein [Chitinophagaceae bacterium]